MVTTLVLVGVGVGVLAALLIVLRRRFFIVMVNGASMVPTYQDGDRLLARRRRAQALPVGSVVVLTGEPGQGPGNHVPVVIGQRAMTLRTSRHLIKRLVARPGDAVPRDCANALGDGGPSVVPPGKVVVFGDNSVNSLDSRVLGFVDERRIIGTVIRRVAAAKPAPGDAPEITCSEDVPRTRK
ncbi:signal peptidase I [Micromonospora qiuiae]|uniref:signal peptidase I n=1 Tax=Micromonospora qiuiae TaxID=502268 RepID=A0ABQ4JES2_9ACTN|nr:S26 family signal peptidase [Micromonospora qiuiae]GIJ28689.1 signal peptidase I [Micromonospora qiuiae]